MTFDRILLTSASMTGVTVVVIECLALWFPGRGGDMVTINRTGRLSAAFEFAIDYLSLLENSPLLLLRRQRKQQPGSDELQKMIRPIQFPALG